MDDELRPTFKWRSSRGLILTLRKLNCSFCALPYFALVHQVNVRLQGIVQCAMWPLLAR
jgi:hypothetical protein